MFSTSNGLIIGRPASMKVGRKSTTCSAYAQKLASSTNSIFCSWYHHLEYATNITYRLLGHSPIDMPPLWLTWAWPFHKFAELKRALERLFRRSSKVSCEMPYGLHQETFRFEVVKPFSWCCRSLKSLRPYERDLLTSACPTPISCHLCSALGQTRAWDSFTNDRLLLKSLVTGNLVRRWTHSWSVVSRPVNWYSCIIERVPA